MLYKGDIIIKKLVTALGENTLNERLKKEGTYDIVGNDIPYQDGVLDILSGNSSIDIVAISETLAGEYEIREFINKIKRINENIKIIFFMSYDNSELEIFLQSNGISEIYRDGENTIEEIIDKICKKSNEVNLNEEIEILKKILEEKEKRIVVN